MLKTCFGIFEILSPLSLGSYFSLTSGKREREKKIKIFHSFLCSWTGLGGQINDSENFWMGKEKGMKGKKEMERIKLIR